jgi:hypothetical protein
VTLTETAADAPTLWRNAPSRWGHPLHSLCSYMAMFPPSIPHVFIKWLTEEGDCVYDPFSGRGTTALEACSLNRLGIGSDLNPMAVVLTSAKTNPPSWELLEARIQGLRKGIRRLPIGGEPEAIRGVFAPGTLGQILWLRASLDREAPEDAFILASLMGILHLNADSRGVAKGLSVSMPNTFAMAPGYVLRYVRDHGLVAPEVDVLELLAHRVERYRDHMVLPRSGMAWAQDASLSGEMETRNIGAKLVFTSPPYLHVMRYGKFNWIRLWLLGETPCEVDSALFSSSSLTRYLEFMSAVLGRLADVIQEDGHVCLVVGDVSGGGHTIRLAEHVAEACVPGSMEVSDIIVDELPGDRKVSRIWGETKGRATKTDRILVLSAKGSGALPLVPSVRWS